LTWRWGEGGRRKGKKKREREREGGSMDAHHEDEVVLASG